MFTRVKAAKLSWKIGVYIPEEDYFGEIIANQRLTLLLTLMVSILATIAGLFVAGLIIRPISELDREAQKIKTNDYTLLPRIRSVFEQIQRTADTFHDMRKAVKNYKQELRKKEQIHCAITDTANEAILMAEKDGMVSYWNTAATILFGYSIEEIMGKNIHDFSRTHERIKPGSYRRPADCRKLFPAFSVHGDKREKCSVVADA